DQARTIPVRVKVKGPDSLPSEGVVQVVLRNKGIAARPESELWYCNDPENIKGPGTLFSASLRAEQPARMLYHHPNASFGGLYVEVVAINDSDAPASLHLIPGDSDPDKNPVLAGIDAGEKFFRNYVRNSGEIVSLPAHSTLPIAMRRLAPHETMSGL